jgi:hypothetical protein
MGPIRFTKGLYYDNHSEKSILRNMVITDEYLNYLGDEFQTTCAKHERGWSFDSWCHEVVGMDITSSYYRVKLSELPYANKKKRK